MKNHEDAKALRHEVKDVFTLPDEELRHKVQNVFDISGHTGTES